MDDEKELIRRAREGASEAFAELVLRHQGRVRAYLARHLRDRDMADDLAQETFLIGLRDLNSYQGHGSLGVWLIGIARNRALDYLRGEARRQAHAAHRFEALLAASRVERLEAEAANPCEEEGRRKAALEDCVRNLPDKSASLIRERYFGGSSAREIAARRATSEEVVRTTLLRIRNALKRCVKQRLAVEGSPP